jgi:hypothetical protein
MGVGLSGRSHKPCLLINDLTGCVDSEVFMFADDTKLYRTIDLHSLFAVAQKGADP